MMEEDLKKVRDVYCTELNVPFGTYPFNDFGAEGPNE
jgi:hypothetical protein